MLIGRREFVMTGLSLAIGPRQATAVASTGRGPNVKAIAFDAFVIFDPRSLASLCDALFPGKGNDLISLWRMRQFEYTWLRTISNRYTDFLHVTDDALNFAVRSLKLELTAEKRQVLLNAHSELKPWPDVIPALEKLRDAGLGLGFLSNFTPGMLNGCIKSSGLERLFNPVLSTDLARTYKPDARAYQLAVDTLNLPIGEIAFAAFAGWDAAGAKSFGYPTFWVNRLGLPTEQLDSLPDGTGHDLAELLAFIGV